ncbi:MAG TPA: SDR family oxidoreductase [Streptosporangiaceae bacterium]|jgi:NAD(P)-dependent dehydrogenase (short-subunit alcohol dehydrogenase family)
MTEPAGQKVAIVTGGGSGIGEALCLELARRGAWVVVADINAGDADRVAAAITGGGGQASASTVDVADEPQVRRLVEDTAAAHGRLDYLFNNAGMAIGGQFSQLTMEHWHEVLDVDLYGVVHGMHAAWPIMVSQGFGHIVNTSSAASIAGAPGNSPYCAAKHAVVGLSLSLRMEGAGLGVRVSCACPGFVRTSIYQNAKVADPDLPASIPREKLAGAPARMLEPGQAARAILAGMARNQALIYFPASIRWGRRAYHLFPRQVDRLMLRGFRRRQQMIQAAAAAAAAEAAAQPGDPERASD